ncbi:MAG: oligosaccharide flippase family protein [Candidatus Omnitrophota bacterium]
MIDSLKKTDAFSKNIVLVFLGNSLVCVFNLIYQMIVAHRFTPVVFAEFNSLLSIFVLVSSPLSTFQTTVVKYIAEFNSQNQIKKIRLLLSCLFKRSLWFCIGTLLIFYFACPYLMVKLKISSPSPVYILAMIIALSWYSSLLLGGLQGLELFRWFTLISIAGGALKLIFTFVFIMLGFNTAGALGALLASGLIVMVIAFWPLKEFIIDKCLSVGEADKTDRTLISTNENPNDHESKNSEGIDFRGFFFYLFPVAISLFCFASLVNLDMVLVKYFFSPADSGLYSLAQMVGKIFLFLPSAISMVMFPMISGLNAKNMDTSGYLKKSLFYAGILCVTAVLIYNLFPAFILKVLTGKAVRESIILGRIFSISMSFFTLTYILITYFLSLKDLRFIKYLVISTICQVMAISLFHNSLFQIQAVLCVNSIILFFLYLKLAFLQHRKVYNILPKPPPDLLCKSKRLGLRKSPITGDNKLSPKAIFL